MALLVGQALTLVLQAANFPQIYYQNPVVQEVVKIPPETPEVGLEHVVRACVHAF